MGLEGLSSSNIFSHLDSKSLNMVLSKLQEQSLGFYGQREAPGTQAGRTDTAGIWVFWHVHLSMLETMLPLVRGPAADHAAASLRNFHTEAVTSQTNTFETIEANIFSPNFEM